VLLLILAIRLSVCDDLVVKHLVPSKDPTNVTKTTSKCIIPPLSEAIIPVTSNTVRDGSFLLEPLPSLHYKHVSPAYAVVSVNNKQTQCRILNPTNASAILPKRTPLATILPIPQYNVFEYEKSSSERAVPTVDYETQLKTLKDLGIEVNATNYTQSQKEKLVTLLYNNRDLFTEDICSLPGTDLVKHTINTGNAPPIRQRPYRHSPEAKKELDKQIDRLIKADMIEESGQTLGKPSGACEKEKQHTSTMCRYAKG